MLLFELMNSLSLIIPVYNEEENLPILYKKLRGVLEHLNISYEVLFVDDGSGDKSYEELKKLSTEDRDVKIIRFARNFGQTAAISAGMQHSSGEVLVFMDADLQNDPEDIPQLLKKIEEGYDVVSGWRKNRQDKFFSRILPSQLANKMISFIIGVYLHDYGCTLKAYKREVIKDIHLYGEMHRFIPAYAVMAHGAKIAELPVRHHPRQFGKSKYGLSRTIKVILDLLVVKFLSGYFTKPMHFFGGVGSAASFIGLAAGLIAIYLKFASIRDFVATPLPIFSALFLILGVQFVLMGLLAEIIIRTYHESQNKPVYLIKEKINIAS